MHKCEGSHSRAPNDRELSLPHEMLNHQPEHCTFSRTVNISMIILIAVHQDPAKAAFGL
jgi:hypothetical protein